MLRSLLRSVLCAGLLLAAPSLAQQAPRGEILPAAPCEFGFTAARDGLQGVAVPIGTFARSNRGTLVGELYAGARLLASAQWPMAELADQAAIELPCPVQTGSAGQAYRLVLRSPDAAAGSAVTAFVDAAGAGVLSPSYAGDTRMLGELLPGAEVVQTFVAAADGLCQVQVAWTDYGRRNAGTLQMAVRDPLRGQELARVTLDAATLGNEDWRGVDFAPVADSAGRSFAVELRALAAVSGSAATVYLERGASYAGELSMGGRSRLGRLMLLCGYGEPARGAALATWGLLGLAGTALLRAGWRRRRGHGGAGGVALAVACVAALAAGRGYVVDAGWLFWGGGLLASLALLVAAARTRRPVVVQLAMVPLLAVGLLLVAQPFGGRGAVAGGREAAVDLAQQPWSSARANGDPAAFRAWWQRLTGEWNAQDRGCAVVQRPDPLGELPFVLIPDRTTRFFDSTIRVNNLGFRGRDIEPHKGDRFRIVCLGESTTMGQTVFAGDRPWPEVLEGLLATPGRRRPIEVVNAGWASYDIRHSAIRLRQASVAKRRLPTRRARPSWLLADAEYGLELAAFRAELSNRAPVATAPADVASSAAAAAYRELLDLARARGIRVALCTFNMAVRADSPPEVVEFYRAGFPQVERQIQANQLQTALLRQLATADGQVVTLDTGQDLDGAYADAFVDLVHFTQTGRDRLARNLAAALAPLLPE